MSILSKVTWQTMRKNRTRTIVTIIGVILSAAMFTAVTTFASSLFYHLKNTCIYNNGSYHICAEGVSESASEKAQADKRVDKYGIFKTVGYADAGSSNEYKPYIYIVSADKMSLELTPIHIVTGRLPENPNEILIPAHLMSNGSVKCSVGDKLSYSVGIRTDESGYPLTQSNPFFPEAGEFIKSGTVKSYTVVGIYERPNFEARSAPGYTAITVGESDTVNDYGNQVFITLKDPTRDMSSFESECLKNINRYENKSVLMFSGYSVYDNITGFLVRMGVVFVLLIMLGSVSLIYSAFSISVSERTKQFGLLSSIGATRRQIRHSVFCEAFIVSAIGIPLGVIAGIGGMGVTLLLCGDRFESLIASPYKMKLTVSPAAVIAAIAVALFTVIISAIIPAKRATRVTAIEAIRQTGDIKASGKNVRTSPLFMKLFGLEGLLAKKYFKRSKRKYRTTVISLTLSIILFISSSSFCLYLKKFADEDIPDYGVDITVSGLSASTADSAIDLIEKLPEVLVAQYGSVDSYIMADDKSTYSAEHLRYIADRDKRADDTGSLSLRDATQPITVYYMNDTAFSDLLKKNGLSDEKGDYSSGRSVLFVNSTKSVEYYRTEKGNERVTYTFDWFTSGVKSIDYIPSLPDKDGYDLIGVYEDDDEKLKMYSVREGEEGANYSFDSKGRPTGDNVEKFDVEVKSIGIGALIDEMPIGVFDDSIPMIIMPISANKQLDKVSCNVYVLTSDHKATVEGIKKALAENGISVSDNDINDYAAAAQDTRNLVVLVNVFSYGFIVLISLISAACVFNTISTNIALRRKDFAMLRSVGMTKKGMDRMMNYECMLYGSRSLMFGLPISLLLSVAIYKISSGSAIGNIELPWMSILIAILSVFAVVFATMLYAMKKVRKENPIDALKNDNI